jgi:hypothetical protein
MLFNASVSITEVWVFKELFTTWHVVGMKWEDSEMGCSHLCGKQEMSITFDPET